LPLFILAVIILIIADVIIRFAIKSVNEKKVRKEREAVLEEELKSISVKKLFR
jgi:Na+-transporting methylmalonyl-CoA/oxaloacetate decarboxylase gamma subunit